MTQEIPFSFTETALRELKNIISTKGIPKEYGLRLGIKGGGCSGISYMLGFDTLKETDLNYTFESISIYIEKKHMMYILGKTVDFEDGINARGFVFKD
ncbi:MAG: HesB/IscA family protein [Cytophagaceae bacterium]